LSLKHKCTVEFWNIQIESCDRVLKHGSSPVIKFVHPILSYTCFEVTGLIQSSYKELAWLASLSRNAQPSTMSCD